ncbi:uncharacterized protein [Typha angustifolia]|uniref:uncharacterized protein n=1 Tax=Typha angustifolia TaxID=59011 RepID=UPI003C2D48E2
MVNWVEAQKPLIHFFAKKAGLRQHLVELDSDTAINFWIPKEKMAKHKSINDEVAPDQGRSKGKEPKPAVVLVHGFATDGIVTWNFQVGALTKEYDVYVPDLLFFGGSTTKCSDRTPGFQAECIMDALGRLGVKKCAVVGFSYGGFVAFKMAEARPGLVRSVVVSGSSVAMTHSINKETTDRLGFSSSAELLLPETVEGVKALFLITTHKGWWIPKFLYKDFLKVMFKNRKEKLELLKGLLINDKDSKIPILPQRILLLWGENDKLFQIKHAEDMKEQLGEKTALQSIKKAGHLVHLERPCVFNRHLKEFLANVHAEVSQD